MKDGHSIDGALPEEMARRRLPVAARPGPAIRGKRCRALVQAELLQRAGYPAWEWEDRRCCGPWNSSMALAGS
ncbi:MAG: hypothetical protein R2911_17795 [Caldilineaceae bacterium]